MFPVAEIAPLTGATGAVRGTVNLHGELTPVVDLGRRVSTAWTELHAEQRLVLVDGPAQRVLLLADEVEGVRTAADDALAAGELTYVDGPLATRLEPL